MTPKGLLTKGVKTRNNIICKKKIFKRSKMLLNLSSREGKKSLIKKRIIGKKC